jgi:hypothetical protein
MLLLLLLLLLLLHFCSIHCQAGGGIDCSRPDRRA